MLRSVFSESGVASSENALLDSTIEEVAAAIAEQQAPDGHWVYDLEADATIPAEYILLNHYVDAEGRGLPPFAVVLPSAAPT